MWLFDLMPSLPFSRFLKDRMWGRWYPSQKHPQPNSRSSLIGILSRVLKTTKKMQQFQSILFLRLGGGNFIARTGGKTQRHGKLQG